MRKVYNSVSQKIENLPNFMESELNNGAMTEEQLNSYNLHLVVYNSKPDSRYFSYNEIGSIDELTNKYIVNYLGVARDVVELKLKMIEELKSIQSKKLSEIDWYWLREMKTGTVVPQEIKDLSTYIYSTSSNKEIEINNLVDINDIILYERTPYEVEIEVLDINLQPTGQTKTVTKYKNQVIDW